MSRPRNETPEDLAREDAARVLLCDKWQCKLMKLDDSLYRCDWALIRNNGLLGWGEYKYRGPTAWGEYNTVLLSVSKWVYMKQLAQQTNKPFFLVFEWGDQIVYGKWPPNTGMGYDIRWGGRTDRGQTGDEEPVIMIPNTEFKIISRG